MKVVPNPHRIALVFAKRDAVCTTGERTKPMDVVVSCDCHRIGDSDGFRLYIGCAPTIPDAWRRWNRKDFHAVWTEFIPNERMMQLHGLYEG